MKRVLVLLALLVGARAAAAKPARITAVWNTCSKARGWEPLTKCLARFGDVAVERTLGRVKVVRVGDASVGPGLYIYAERTGAVELLGMWQVPEGSAVQLLGFDAISIRGRTGYRLDVGSLEPTSLVLDPQNVIDATMQRKTSVFCFEGSSFCRAAVESCDVLVAGKAYFTFRGVMTLSGSMVTVDGDRSRAGSCEAPEQVILVDGSL